MCSCVPEMTSGRNLLLDLLLVEFSLVAVPGVPVVLLQ